MIARLMLSLKKAAISQEYGWNLGQPTTNTTMKWSDRRSSVTARDEMSLAVFASKGEVRCGDVKDVTESPVPPLPTKVPEDSVVCSC